MRESTPQRGASLGAKGQDFGAGWGEWVGSKERGKIQEKHAM